MIIIPKLISSIQNLMSFNKIDCSFVSTGPFSLMVIMTGDWAIVFLNRLNFAVHSLL